MNERRQFLRHATSNLAALTALGAIPVAPRVLPSIDWDMSWPARLAKRRAVFDVVEIESGFGVFRAAVWADQSVAILGDSASDVSPVIVLRSHAVALALQQSFWDEYGVGRLKRVTHPVSLKETMRNPALMSASDGLPTALLATTLTQQLARGTTVLACNLALQSWIDAIRQQKRITDADARKEAISALVPGIVLQPSGVLAAAVAQEHGCVYIRAS